MGIPRIGNRTENGAMTVGEGTSENNRALSGAQLKHGERGIGMLEVLLVFAISDGVFSVVSAVYGILGAIFDWFD